MCINIEICTNRNSRKVGLRGVPCRYVHIAIDTDIDIDT